MLLGVSMQLSDHKSLGGPSRFLSVIATAGHSWPQLAMAGTAAQKNIVLPLRRPTRTFGIFSDQTIVKSAKMKLALP